MEGIIDKIINDELKKSDTLVVSDIIGLCRQKGIFPSRNVIEQRLIRKHINYKIWA